MTATLSRRNLFAAGFAAAATAALSPDAVWAEAARAAAAADWRLGVADVETDLAKRRLKLVHGRAPKGLGGVLYRNGPAKFHRPGGDEGHWFDGDGLIRAFRISEGSATLDGRFADTPKRRAEAAANAQVMPGFGTPASPKAHLGGPDDANAANTSIYLAGDKVWALWEAGSPTAMDPATLKSEGFVSFRPDLKGMPFSAHPRIEPNGRTWNVGSSGEQMVIWRLSASGALEAIEPIKLPTASYVHDFTATDRHIIVVLQPWVWSGFQVPFNKSFAWKPELGTRVVVADKADLSRQRVYELPAFAFFHLGDAWSEADGTIRFDICAYADPAIATTAGSALIKGQYLPTAPPQLALATLRPDGRASLERSGVVAEFPRSDARRAGLQRHVTYHVTNEGMGRPMARGISAHDWSTGKTDTFDFGARHLIEEALFVPNGPGERDGWLVGTGVNLDARATELHVFNAAHVSDGPVCTWRADVALPVGFHGAFART